MTDLPEGVITFLMTDIEGSSRMWERDPTTAGQALALHDIIIESAVERNGGTVVRPRGEGDSRFAVFRQATDAVVAAVAIQRDLGTENWPTETPLRVRTALHTGEADLRLGDYYGTVVNRCARIRSISHGGQTLLSQATSQLVMSDLPSGVTLRDMGRHRLKDLARPEQVFQLVIPDLQADFPPLKSLSGVAHNLPAQVTELVGRERELAEIQELLTQTRLLTLAGPGGIGKTRLAIEVARRRSAGFPQGMYFIPLTPLDSADQLVQAAIEVLALSIAGEDDLKAQLLRYLQSQQMFLVMDNFEHLMDGVPFVAEILEAAPQVSVMVTSREKLNLIGETLFTVAGLDYGDWGTPEEAMSHSAAQLFVQSAQHVRPGFELRREDVRPVARMCELVDGMPLGILLAAAWVDVLSPGEIFAEIEKSLDFLESEMQNLPARQRSLNAVFDTSWERLSEHERELFERLSVFRGGFSREAAVEVTGASLRGISGLLNKSFLRRDPVSGRFEIHELLRQYGQERLERSAELSADAYQAHALYFANFMEEADLLLRSDRQRETLALIEIDIENVRRAWRFVATQGNVSAVRKFIDGLWFIHEIRGWLHAGLQLFSEIEETLRREESNDETRLAAAQMMAARGWFTTLLGSAPQGLELAQEAAATLRELGRRRELPLALLAIAIGNFFQNRNDQVILAAQEMLDIALELQMKWWETLAYNWLGSASMSARALDDASSYAATSSRMAVEIGDHWLSVWPGQVLAALAAATGDSPEAKARYQSVLAAAQTIDFKRGMLYTLYNLGNVSSALEEYGEAEEYYLQSLNICREMGYVRDMAANACQLARVWATLDRKSAAIELLAVVIRHPASDQHALFGQIPIREEAEQLRAKLEEALPADEYVSAWERGKTLELEAVVAQLYI